MVCGRSCGFVAFVAFVPFKNPTIGSDDNISEHLLECQRIRLCMRHAPLVYIHDDVASIGP